MLGVQIRYHRGQVLDVPILGANRAAPPMRVSAPEESESPQEGIGGAGPALRRHYWPSRPLRYRRWARISIRG